MQSRAPSAQRARAQASAVTPPPTRTQPPPYTTPPPSGGTFTTSTSTSTSDGTAPSDPSSHATNPKVTLTVGTWAAVTGHLNKVAMPAASADEKDHRARLAAVLAEDLQDVPSLQGREVDVKLHYGVRVMGCGNVISLGEGGGFAGAAAGTGTGTGTGTDTGTGTGMGRTSMDEEVSESV
ncbi:hypothetical protein MMC11_006985 [Xylographa trunciseda]|nr:hypothetical protein [Xylographa trunciseda]